MEIENYFGHWVICCYDRIKNELSNSALSEAIELLINVRDKQNHCQNNRKPLNLKT